MNRDSDKYHLLIESLPDAFSCYTIVADEDGTPVDYIFHEVNTAFEEIAGLKKEMIIGKKITEILPGIEKSKFDWFSIFSQAILSGEVTRFESFFETLGRWHEVCAYSDEPGCFVVIFRDITKYKQAEQALHESEFFSRTVMDHLPIGLAVNSVDPEVNFTYMNDNFPKIYHTTRDALFDQDVFWEVVYEDPQFRSEIKQRVLKDCASGDLEKMWWKDIPITRNGKIVAYISAGNIPVPEKDLMISTVLDVTGRVKTEEALRKSEEKHRRLFETMDQGVIYQAADGKIISANPAAERILGFTLDQMQGKTSTDLHWQMIEEDGRSVPGTDHPAMIALRTGQKVGPLTRGVFHPEKKSHIWLSITAIPLFQPGETKPFQAYATFTDITERKQAEEALLSEKREKDLIVNNLAEQVAFLDLEMNIIWVNSEVLKRHNLRSKKYLGEKCYKVYHQLNEPCPDCPIIDVFKTGEPSCGIHRSPDGRYWQMAGTPVFDNDGVMLGVLDTALDVSDLKLAEQALQESETRFQRMLKVIPDMVSVHDHDMNIVYSNWKGFADVPPEKQVLNTKCYKTYRDYDQICPDCRAVEVLDSEEAFQKEVELSDDYWIDLRVIPILDNSGEVEYFIEWVRDISGLKAIEEELKKLNVNLERKVEERTAQLEAANRELDAFTHSASHDLRGPLNRISGFSHALLEDYPDQLDQQGRHYLQRIKSSCEHMKQLIDDLLKLSRVSQMQVSREPVELSALVSINLKELQARDPNRQVETAVTPGLVAEGDTALLRIALENLLGNAWKYTAGEDLARIEFGSTVQEGNVVYYIRDNGIGFDMKHAEKLFTAFQRLHDGKKYPGTGIGLSIVYRIISRHSGEIWAEGEPGKSACFFFTLP